MLLKLDSGFAMRKGCTILNKTKKITTCAGAAIKGDSTLMDTVKKTQAPLQNRVNDYLRTKPLAYAVEEPMEESIEAIFSLLQNAESELQLAQERVNRFKWELEKARS